MRHTDKQCDQFSTTLIKRHLQLPQAAAEIWHRVQSARNCRVVSAVFAFVVVVVGAAAASFAIKCMVKSRRRTRSRMQMQLPLQLQLARC